MATIFICHKKAQLGRAGDYSVHGEETASAVASGQPVRFQLR